MIHIRKACPVVLRGSTKNPEILAFEHPLAGRQIVKGTVKAVESPVAAAVRELAEESGVVAVESPLLLGQSGEIVEGQVWWFFLCPIPDLVDSWSFRTTDDGGHEFRFFWHPLGDGPVGDWHPPFVRALAFIEEAMMLGWPWKGDEYDQPAARTA
ncbi:NUDIX domain-containing protein [Pelagibius sp. Alg239-R121]|uniref:NUDIX hydrolase n=1 Tax=Pelagibius sp. Alg239-R121 TaxID=2993448 RepID=UPI0024A6308F|nr:NUDIX domain-containing protein [Pelagibius sp. Alg239-R121]